MAGAEPVTAASANVAARMCRIMRCAPSRSMRGGKGDAGAHLGDRLVDQAERALAMPALVRLGLDEFGAGRLQYGNALVHMRLGADRIADAEARRDGRAEHEAAG